MTFKKMNNITIKKHLLKVQSKWILAAASVLALAVPAGVETYSALHSSETDLAPAVHTAAEAEPQEMVIEVAGKTAVIDKFAMPAKGRVTSRFGNRIHPIYKTKKMHYGIDIAGSGPIASALGGKVTRARYDSGWGWYVKIDHGNGIQTLYAHLKAGSLKVKEGSKVTKGQQIGTMGTTGASTGVHLHFEVYRNNKRVDPAPYLGL